MLDRHTEDKKLGMVLMEATFVLPDTHDPNWVTGSRTPDILFITQDRIEAYWAANPDWEENPYLIVPDFVIEIVSPTDSFSKIDEKVDAYLADGVRLVWVLDPQRRKAFVYSPDDEPKHLSGDDLLDAGDVVLGFRITLQALFA
jgi:Uma2 family endonuclease